MAMLGPLPARKALSEEIEDAAYGIVMATMTAHGLEEAVRAALRGEHGSTFFPSPPELKHLYDRAMEWHERELDRIHRREQIERDRPPPIRQRTPEELTRQKERMSMFYKNMGFEEGQTIAQERAPLDPALLAQIPDAPSTFKRTRVA